MRTSTKNEGRNLQSTTTFTTTPRPRSFPPSRRRERRALLIFADARTLDLQRRRLSDDFGVLFQNPSVRRQAGPGHRPPPFHDPEPPASTRSRRHFGGGRFGDDPPAAGNDLCRETGIRGRNHRRARLHRSRHRRRGLPPTGRRRRGHGVCPVERHSLVLGPDQRGGCYLIGLRLKDRARLRGVCWQRDTDCGNSPRASARHARFCCRRNSISTPWPTSGCWPVALAAAPGWPATSSYSRGQRSAGPRARSISSALQRQRARWQLPPPLLGAHRPTHALVRLQTAAAAFFPRADTAPRAAGSRRPAKPALRPLVSTASPAKRVLALISFVTLPIFHWRTPRPAHHAFPLSSSNSVQPLASGSLAFACLTALPAGSPPPPAPRMPPPRPTSVGSTAPRPGCWIG